LYGEVVEVKVHTTNTVKILQLLLRCGMICREELNVVMELMPSGPDSRLSTVKEQGESLWRCCDGV
jgi:hypothetical protein